MPKVKPDRAPFPNTPVGWDGTTYLALTVDESGHLQIDTLSSALPSGAATDTVLQAVRDRLGALTSPAAGSANKLLTDALTALQLIDNLQAALGSVGTDLLLFKADDMGSAVTPAIKSQQVSMVTALEKIDDLQDALESVDTDALQVRGRDQLFSLKDTLVWTGSYQMPGDGSYSHNSGAVPAGEYWVITNIYGTNTVSVASRVFLAIISAGGTYTLKLKVSPVVHEGISWQGWIVLKEDDYVRMRWIDNLNNDWVNLSLVGFKMTVES